MAFTAESLIVLLVAVLVATLTMMGVARLMLGSLQAETRITTGRYLLTALITIGLLFVISLIPWPRGAGSLGTVAVLVALIYVVKSVLLPNTAPSEQWPRSVWMSVIAYTVFLVVNLLADALFGVAPFSL